MCSSGGWRDDKVSLGFAPGVMARQRPIHLADDIGAVLLLFFPFGNLALLPVLFEPGIPLPYHPLHLVMALAVLAKLIDKTPGTVKKLACANLRTLLARPMVSWSDAPAPVDEVYRM